MVQKAIFACEARIRSTGMIQKTQRQLTTAGFLVISQR